MESVGSPTWISRNQKGILNIEQGMLNDDPPWRMKYRLNSLRNSLFRVHYSLFNQHVINIVSSKIIKEQKKALTKIDRA
jgi:hypothetical protein